jgi:hypothetical protein
MHISINNMDIEKIIRKINKNIQKELRYLIKETTILKDLKEDVGHIEQLLSQARSSKEASLLIAHYEKEAVRKVKYSERIERKLNSIVEKITKLILDEEGKLTSLEKRNLEKFRSHLEIIKNNLTRILAFDGELHDLIKEKKDWKKIQNKINEALGTEIKPGILSLIAILEKLKNFQNIIEPIIDENLIDKNGRIIDFEEFFDSFDERGEEVTGADILYDKNINAAKGISFLVVLDSLSNHKNLEIKSSEGSYANVLELNEANFGDTWQHGIAKQNFSFSIYFNTNDIVANRGEKIVERGYTKSYIKTVAAASPQKARELLRQKVLRVDGLLSWKSIKYVGFRYRDEGRFKFKFYHMFTTFK